MPRRTMIDSVYHGVGFVKEILSNESPSPTARAPPPTANNYVLTYNNYLLYSKRVNPVRGTVYDYML